jgi:hypothetical protein
MKEVAGEAFAVGIILTTWGAGFAMNTKAGRFIQKNPEKRILTYIPD